MGNQRKRKQRKPSKAERRAAARRERQKRTLAYVLSGVFVAALVVLVVFVAGGGGDGGSIGPSAAGEVEVAGPPRDALLEPGEQVPAFTAPGFTMVSDPDAGSLVAERADFDWADYAGSKVVLSLWAPWCPSCQKELPVLQNVVSEFPDVKLVTIVTSIDDQPGPTPDGYMADNGLTFPTAIDDADETLARAFGLRYFPTIYFVNSDGTVSQAGTGEISAADLRGAIGALA